MTRENKLALVVGFGLILFVGILVSDHFSEASGRQPAELSQVIDPLTAARMSNPDLISLRRETITDRSADPDAATPPAAGRPPAGDGRGDGRDDVEAIVPGRPAGSLGMLGMGSDARRDATRHRAGHVGLPPAQADALPYRRRDVRPGESLSSICDAEYGDQSLAAALATYNGMDDPDDLRSGRRLRIPAADVLVRGGRSAAVTDRATAPSSPAPSSGPPTPARPGRDATYTVRASDSLSEIAQRLLGSAREYRLIFEANRDVLKSPDAIREGMVLRIPRTGS